MYKQVALTRENGVDEGRCLLAGDEIRYVGIAEFILDEEELDYPALYTRYEVVVFYSFSWAEQGLSVYDSVHWCLFL